MYVTKNEHKPTCTNRADQHSKVNDQPHDGNTAINPPKGFSKQQAEDRGSGKPDIMKRTLQLKHLSDLQ